MRYRIKTRKEFEEEYGVLDETINIKAGWANGMEYLLNSHITEEQYKEIIQNEIRGDFLEIDTWSISSDMIKIESSVFINVYEKLRQLVKSL